MKCLKTILFGAAALLAAFRVEAQSFPSFADLVEKLQPSVVNISTTKQPDDNEFIDAIKIDDVISFLNNNKEDLFVVGGASIYKLAIPYANRLYISIIKGEYEGDTYFPKFNLDDFKIISENETEKVIYYIYERNDE